MKERGKNCAILFVALSHSWFSSLLACHTACLTQKTTSLSKQSKSASKILRKTAKSVQYFPKNAYYTCFSHEILINVFNIFGTNSHVKHKKCKHRNWVRIISREKKKRQMLLLLITQDTTQIMITIVMAEPEALHALSGINCHLYSSLACQLKKWALTYEWTKQIAGFSVNS